MNSLPPVIVLLGGGIESTALVSRYLQEGRAVVPVHVRCDLLWDAAESASCQNFLEQFSSDRLAKLIEIRVPLNYFLARHWAVTGQNPPRAGAPAEELEIPLRNLLLLSLSVHQLAGSVVSRDDTWRLALGTTIENSYRDGSREYFNECEKLLSLETGRTIEILTPFIGVRKVEVIRETDPRVLACSFSCVNPRKEQHCGECIKCEKRRAAFREAGVTDPTRYAV